MKNDSSSASSHAHHAHEPAPTAGQLHLKVDGMHCASCAASVQSALEAVAGVQSAAVNVIDGRATVTGHHLDAASVIKAVQATGYEAKPIDGDRGAAETRSQIEHHHMFNESLWKRRAIIGLGLWVPLEALHWFGHAMDIQAAWIGWVLFAGSTVAFALVGGGFYQSAWGAAKRKTTNMDTLIAMGATTAYVYSLIVFFAQLTGHLHDEPLYFAEGAALLGIISLGHWMEARATAKASSAVRELLELQPDTAEIFEIHGSGSVAPSNGVPRTILSAEVQPGDHLLIRPGGRIPVDGVVVDGESEVDEAVVTGESVPVRRKPNDRVVAGSVNTTGRLVVKAEVDGRNTTISRIAEMVQRAQTSKADIQKLADRVSAVFVPTVLVIALITFGGWWLAGNPGKGARATVTVLIISCPCALGLATPMAVMVGAGAASRRGILVKSAMALETAGRATTVVFDKTGTLTTGKATVTNVNVTTPLAPGSAGASQDHSPEDMMLRLAAAVESPSEHSIARAIVVEADKRTIAIPAVSEFEAIPGQGVRGLVEGQHVTVLRDEQATCRVELDGKIIGTITVADALRTDSPQAVKRLISLGMRVVMLTGDRRAVAESIGSQLQLAGDQIVAEATPESKLKRVAELSRTSHGGTAGGTIMVGDGINDAAALAQADLGIAMAGGTNIAIESADVVIPGDRVVAVAETVEIARATLRTIKQNLFFAFFYNSVAIPAAALGLLGPIGPIVAAAAMGFSDITVIGNAIRLKRALSRRT
jgi:Cu+-exporting ATPase